VAFDHAQVDFADVVVVEVNVVGGGHLCDGSSEACLILELMNEKSKLVS
jgi:hypothetical protein